MERGHIGRRPHPVVYHRHSHLQTGALLLAEHFDRGERKPDAKHNTAILLEFGQHLLADEDVGVAPTEQTSSRHTGHDAPTSRTENDLSSTVEVTMTKTYHIPRLSLGKARGRQRLRGGPLDGETNGAFPNSDCMHGEPDGHEDCQYQCSHLYFCCWGAKLHTFFFIFILS